MWLSCILASCFPSSMAFSHICGGARQEWGQDVTRSPPPRRRDGRVPHLALVQVADDLLEELLLQLLLRPRVLAVLGYQVGGAGFVGPLRESNRDTFRQRDRVAPTPATASGESDTSSSSACSSSVYAASV